MIPGDAPASASTIHATVCPVCGDLKFFDLPRAAFRAWWAGTVSVQEAFPDLPPDDRERMVTGLCPACWAATFAGETGDR